VAFACPFQTLPTNEPDTSQGSDDPKAHPRAGSLLNSKERDPCQHERRRPLSRERGEFHGHTTSERMADDDDPAGHLVEDRFDERRVFLRTPRFVGRGRRTEAWEVDRDRVDHLLIPHATNNVGEVIV